MRLLVLDQSQILPRLVGCEFPTGLEIQAVSSFREAERIITTTPPDAALISLPPASLPWREFQHVCASRNPPIPVLYESCLATNSRELGLESGDGYAAILQKPASRAELRAALSALLATAERCAELG
jgi:DNA-binding response OmpR family regulator